MKKIIFFSILLVSSIILVASCESGPSKSIDTTIGPNGCTCTIGLTARKPGTEYSVSGTDTQEYSREQLVGWYTDCSQLEPFLKERYDGFSIDGAKVTSVTVACLPK